MAENKDKNATDVWNDTTEYQLFRGNSQHKLIIKKSLLGHEYHTY